MTTNLKKLIDESTQSLTEHSNKMKSDIKEDTDIYFAELLIKNDITTATSFDRRASNLQTDIDLKFDMSLSQNLLLKQIVN